jgi:hypothetical protein
MSGPVRREPRILRVGFLTLLFVSMGGLAVGFVSMFLMDMSRHAESVNRGTSLMMVGLLTATGGLSATVVLQTGRLVWPMRAVIMLLAVTAAWWTAFIWIVGDVRSESLLVLLATVGGTLAIVTLAPLFVGQLAVIETDRPALSWARWILAVDVVVFAAAMITLLWSQWWKRFGELVGTTSTIWGLGTLAAMGILRMLVRQQARKRPPADSVAARTRLRLACPRCGAEQELPTGLVRCGRCRRALLIEVQEPRCACGYLLFRLEGDRCPECGRAIPQAGQATPPA